MQSFQYSNQNELFTAGRGSGSGRYRDMSEHSDTASQSESSDHPHYSTRSFSQPEQTMSPRTTEFKNKIIELDELNEIYSQTKQSVSQSLRNGGMNLPSSSKSDPNFHYCVDLSGIELDDETILRLKHTFDQFVPFDEPSSSITGVKVRRLNLQMMKRQYEKLGLDESQPSMYSMVCWMVKDAKEIGVDSLTFEEFLQWSLCFFSQRDHEKGLRYIFELYDTERRGYLSFPQFEKIFISLELGLSKSDMKVLFKRASSDKDRISFKDFAEIMKQDK